jgi:hypothetical protein
MLLFVDLAHCWLQRFRARVIRGYVRVCQRDGWTPFGIAQRKGHPDVAALLAVAGGR